MSGLRKNILSKSVMGAITAVTLVAGIAAVASPAEAQWRGHRGHYRGGWGGAGIAAGVVGGLALGAFAAQAAPRHHYPSYGYGYAPAYAASPYACYNQRRPAYDPWGNFVGYRLVRICQ